MSSLPSAVKFSRHAVRDAVRRADDRLRVALVAPPYFDVPPKAYGGVEAVVADLADALVARGHNVDEGPALHASGDRG